MGLLDLFFPKKCFGCKITGRYICQICIDKLKTLRHICSECEKPSIDGFTHSACKTHKSLDGVTSIWAYEGAIRKALISLKYKFTKDIVNELSEHMAIQLQNHVLPKDATLLPIPAHKLRQNWRGFNQSEELGKLVAKKMNWRYSPEVLVRSKRAVPQTELKRIERKKNIRGVFKLNPVLKKQVFNDLSIILFDDVWTTGSTMREAAKVLKRHGAKEVWGLTIAR